MNKISTKKLKKRKLFKLLVSCGFGIVILLTAAILWLYLRPKEPDFGLLAEKQDYSWREYGHARPYTPSAAGVTKVWPAESSVPQLHDGLKILKRINLRAEQPLRGLRVILDAGHGGSDPGTVWPQKGKHEFEEKEAALLLAEQIKLKLQAAGTEVVTLRDRDEFVSVYNRSATAGRYILNEYLQGQADEQVAPKQGLARTLTEAERRTLGDIDSALQEIIAKNKDSFGGILGGIGATPQAEMLMDIEKQFVDVVYLSVHVNSSAHSDVGGTQVYLLRSPTLFAAQNILPYEGSEFSETYLPDAKAVPFYPLYLKYDDEARLRLARGLYTAVARTAPEMRTNIAKSVLEENFAVIRTCNLPGVLFETGFITNERDRKFLWSKTGRDKLATAVVDGLKTYVELMQKFAKHP